MNRIRKSLVLVILMLFGFTLLSCSAGDSWYLNRNEENALYSEAIIYARSLSEEDDFVYTAKNTYSNLIVRHEDGVFESLEENNLMNRYYFDGILHTRIPDSDEIVTSTCDFDTLGYLASIETMRTIVAFIFAEDNVNDAIERYSGVGSPWETVLSFEVDSEWLMAEGAIPSDITKCAVDFYEYDDGCYAITLTLYDSSFNRVLRIVRDIGFEPIHFPEDIITTITE